MKKNYSSYLDRYTAVNVWPIFDLCDIYEALIIPARAEVQTFERLQESLERIKQKNFLVVLIVNSPLSHPEEFSINRQLIQKIKLNARSVIDCERFSLARYSNYFIYIADFGSNKERAFEIKKGVGLARKLASDFACRLRELNILKSEWIHSTDSDVILPEDYFQEVSDPQFSFIHYRYAHSCSSEASAISQYEKFLRYHRLGLSYAKSPYAYPAIGSCLKFRIENYVAARGFPVKEAGEDFYLLNKLRKLGCARWASSGPLQIEAREQIRTPFGTSASIKKISQSENYRVYAPQIYEGLRIFLEGLEEWSLQPQNSSLRKFILEETAESFFSLPQLEAALGQAKSLLRKRRIILEYFDAFRTLKWIHWKTENFYPKIPLAEALSKALTFDIKLEKLRDIDESIDFLEPPASHPFQTPLLQKNERSIAY